MIVPKNISLEKTVKTLWRRALLWRFLCMSAALLTLLFLLFSPERQQSDNDATKYLDNVATYISQTPKTTIDSSQNLITPASIKGSAPQTADLSLSTPNNAQNDAIKQQSGLDAAVLGKLYTGTLKMGGYDISLINQSWIMLAQSKMEGPKAIGRGYILGRIWHKRLMDEIVVHALKAKPGQTLDPLKDMSKFNVYYKSDECKVQNSSSCWMVYGLFTSGWAEWGDHNLKIDNLTRAAVGNLAAKGISYPQDLVIQQFIRIEPWGSLEVAYGFNPESANIKTSEAASSADTDWAPANINRYPEKVEYIKHVINAGIKFWPNFKTAFEAAK